MELGQTLEQWVIGKVDDWGDFYDQNFDSKHKEYDRLWRGIFRQEDKTRDSERSTLISPATSQAVESSVAEVEEAIFGRGRFFDVTDNLGDQEKEDVQFLRNKLDEDLANRKVRKAVSEVVLNAAVTGTGIGEVVVEEIEELSPANRADGEFFEVGVETKIRTVVGVRSIHPRNFRIDPAATCIDEALGCAIDEYVPTHLVKQLQEDGTYLEGDVGSVSTDNELSTNQDLSVQPNDKVRLTKYFGLVPSELLEDSDDKEYTEALVIIGNGSVLLKAEKNPFMMGDRPIIHFPWDVVPNQFHGRGVVEKGYNSQKALDAELRARADALALTIHPMIAVDGSRMPRGAKPRVSPGKTIITNGNPNEILNPFKFGEVNQITFAQSESLQRMLQMATGAVDSNGITSVNGEAAAAGISMALGAIIKRHKRTLVNFQDSFLIPMVKKVAYRYMQFDPDNYPVADYKFNVSSSLGIMAREYEVTQLVQLLQTMSPDSPAYNVLVESVVDNMNLSNREQIISLLKQAAEPNPEEVQQKQEAFALEMAQKRSQVKAFDGQAEEFYARAGKLKTETKAIPMEVQIDQIKAITSGLSQGSEDDKEFERRLRVADMLMKERGIAINEAATIGNLVGGSNGSN